MHDKLQGKSGVGVIKLSMSEFSACRIYVTQYSDCNGVRPSGDTSSLQNSL